MKNRAKYKAFMSQTPLQYNVNIRPFWNHTTLIQLGGGAYKFFLWLVFKKEIGEALSCYIPPNIFLSKLSKMWFDKEAP